MDESAENRRIFGRQLCHTGRLWRRVVDKELTAYGLTEATWLPLLYASRASKPLRQKELAEQVCIESSTLVRLVDALTRDGLMERQTCNDRRANLLTLTESGRQRVKQVEKTLSNLRNRLLSEIDDREIAVTLSVIDRVAATLTDMSARKTDDM